MVLACGVRKVWTKEFQTIQKSSQQIKRLKEILTELGMSGRFRLQQAKAIKEKRELAQELGKLGVALQDARYMDVDVCVFGAAEDVQTFEQMVASSGKTKPSSEASDDESPDEAPVKRKVGSISTISLLH
jgi:hypothetical protein